jgi:hypothetical protein
MEECNDEGFTIAEYVDHYGICYCSARGRLQKMVAAGRLVKGWKRVSSGGAMRKVVCFRLPSLAATTK